MTQKLFALFLCTALVYSCRPICDDDSDYTVVSSHTNEFTTVDLSWKQFPADKIVIYKNLAGDLDTFYAGKQTQQSLPLATDVNSKRCTKKIEYYPVFNWGMTHYVDSVYYNIPPTNEELGPGHSTFSFSSGNSNGYDKTWLIPGIGVKFRKNYNANVQDGCKYPFTTLNNFQQDGQVYNDVYLISADTTIADSGLIIKRIYFQRSLGVIRFDRADGTEWHLFQ